MAEQCGATNYPATEVHFKCVKCKNVPKDACTVSCGCQYCRSCIDGMIAVGIEFCTGVLPGCGKTYLSSASRDVNNSNSILPQTVICPNYGCLHQCPPTQLDQHISVCPKKCIQCPFFELGCKKSFEADQINIHLLSGNCSYINLLGEMQPSAMVTVVEMRAVINTLLQHISLSENNSSILDEIKSIKSSNEELADQVRLLESRINSEKDDRQENLCHNSNKIIDHFDKKLSAINRMIGSDTDEFGMEIKSDRNELDNDIPPTTQNPNSKKSIMGEIRLINRFNTSMQNDIYHIKSKLHSIEGALQIDASYEWTIDADVREPHWDWPDKEIEHFYGVMHRYKYRLATWNYDTQVNSLRIHLRIYWGDRDADLPWPFRATVTVCVIDMIKIESSMRLTQKCEIKRPAENRYTFSDDFVFPFNSLISAGVELGNGLRVFCTIVPDNTRRYGLYSWLWSR